MDVDDFVNAPVEDDEDDADEQKGSKMSISARFKQAVLTLPQSVRVLLVVPLWAAGTAILTMISFLWNVLFASPLGAFIASLALGFAIMLGLFTVTAKALFPDVPLRKILCRRNVIIIGCLALLLSGIDAVAPIYWSQYPLAAALVKLVLGGSVIGYLSHHVGKVFKTGVLSGIPPVARIARYEDSNLVPAAAPSIPYIAPREQINRKRTIFPSSPSHVQKSFAP